MSQYPPVLELNALDGDNGFALAGAGGIDFAGDVNADGVNDVVLVASAAVYVLFGRPATGAEELDVGTPDGTNGFKIVGPGGTVSSAGDVNGDGFDDVFMGASGANDGNTRGAGSAYVVFGSDAALPPTVNLKHLDGSDGFKVVGTGKHSFWGREIAPAGDLNGDGFDDMVLGGYNRAVVLFGRGTGFDAELDLADLSEDEGFFIAGGGSYTGLGSDVSSAGDINGDGFDDLLVGAPGGPWEVNYYRYGTVPGCGYVIFGRSDFDRVEGGADLDGTNGFRVSTPSPDNEYDYVGRAMSSAGDFNGDGFDDIIVGKTGSAFVVFGKADGFAADLDLTTPAAGEGFAVGGLTEFQRLGACVTGAGDVNGDGFDDIVLTANAADVSGADSGALYVIFGTAEDMPEIFDLTDLNGSNGFRIDGESELDRIQMTADAPGDLNGDGLADLLVESRQDPARAYVVYGQGPETAVDRVGTIADQTLVGGDFDDRLRGVGGDDLLHGHDGEDKMLGGEGSDTLFGGGGADKLRGEGGRDFFVYRGVGSSRPGDADVITRLQDNDRIDLSAIDANSKAAGDQAFARVSAFTGVRGELVVTLHTGGPAGDFTTIEGDVNGDGDADLLIALKGDHQDFSGIIL